MLIRNKGISQVGKCYLIYVWLAYEILCSDLNTIGFFVKICFQ